MRRNLITIKGSRFGLIIKLNSEEDFHKVLRHFTTKLQEVDDFLIGAKSA